MMKKVSSLFRLVPLLVACLLLAKKGTYAQESKDRRQGTMLGGTGDRIIDPFEPLLGKSENMINSSRRRLYKSNNVHTARKTTWQGWNAGYRYYSKATKKDGKGKKSGKAKSAKNNMKQIPAYPWMGWGARPAHKPTRKPTRRPQTRPTPRPTRNPSSITPPTLPPKERSVEISMGGVLAATNLAPIPASGSDQMKELARIFEETILSSLEDGYKCIVYEIGGTPVHVGGVRSVIFNRRLQDQSQVRFTLRVTKPCSGCDKSEAMLLGSKVFDQTFETLNESAESGDMTTTFCGNAEGTGVIPSPCQVTITSVEGSSLDVKFVEDTTPTPSPTVMKWDPTPAPTLQPVTSAPTREGATASPTDVPTPSPINTYSPVVVPTTMAPTEFKGQPTGTPTLNTPAPSIATIPTTIAPTSTPPGAIYYTGFETGKFPDDSYWTTSESAPWITNTERVQSGVYSIRSANLDSTELTPRDSNVTFTTGDDFPAGVLVLNILAGVRMPFDDFRYYVDGQPRGRLEGETEFKRLDIPMGPGKHEVLFEYKFNPVGLPQFPDTGDYERIGAVYMDNVSLLPAGITLPPTQAPAVTPAPTAGKTSIQPTASSTPQTAAPQTDAPTTPTPSSVVVTPAPTEPQPTYAPTSSVTTSTPSDAPSIPPSKASTPSFFDGFETGDFSAEDWSITGEDAWVVDETRPYEGLYSAHVRTEDIPESQLFSELSLPVSLEAPGFIQFYFFAPISVPFESLQLWVDGQFLTPLTTEGGEWAQAGSVLSSGDHTVSWRYSRNPVGAPDDFIDTFPQPDFRLGEAWLDNVRLLPSTPSFTENWDSGDFSANPWILSGDGNWTITDTQKFEGEYSATVAAADIEASTGMSDLSIDLITEKGGTLTCEVLPSLQSPFDLFQILIDDIKVYEISEIQDDWQSQELIIQPGKRQVTFRLVKDPNNLGEAVISSLPKDPDYQGQVWLDTIVFTANS